MKKLKRIAVALLAVIFLANSFGPAFADDLADLKGELQALRDEVKFLKDELKTVKTAQGKFSVTAQEPAAEVATQNDLDGLRNDLDTLRDQWQRTLDKKTAQTKRSLTLGGTVTTRATVSRSATATTSNGFSVPSVGLTFKGNLYKDNQEGKNLDYAFGLSSANGAAPLLTDGYLTYNFLATKDISTPLLAVAVGQQKKPFGRDPQTGDEYKPTINTALTDTNLALGTRDVGIIFRGDLLPTTDYAFNYRAPLVEYAFGVVNGKGVASGNGVDDNASKDIVGRVGLNAPVDYNSIFRGLSAGISGWSGPKSVTSSTSTNLTRRLNRNRWGYDVAYNRMPVGLTAEYAQGIDPTLTGTTPANAVERQTRSDGYIFTGYYNFGQQFLKNKDQERFDDWYPKTYQPFIRYEKWDPNKTVSHDQIGTRTLGLNIFFAETTKLQLNVNHVTNQSKGVAAGAAYDEYLVQFQYGF